MNKRQRKKKYKKAGSFKRATVYMKVMNNWGIPKNKWNHRYKRMTKNKWKCQF